MVWRQEAKSGTVAGSRALGPVRPTRVTNESENQQQEKNNSTLNSQSPPFLSQS